MLRAIRTLGVEKRWVYGIVMGLVVVAFVGTMGWMGMSGTAGLYAAKVNGEEILIGDYNRRYENRYRELERTYGEQFNEEMVKAMNLRLQVLMNMIDYNLWVAHAEKLGLRVSNAELKDELLAIEAFQVNGRFNSDVYRRVLSRNGATPESFETSMRRDLMASKARLLVRAGTSVLESEIGALAQAGADQDLSAEEKAVNLQARRVALKRMKEARTVAAYTDYLRGQARIEIFKDAIGIPAS